MSFGFSVGLNDGPSIKLVDLYKLVGWLGWDLVLSVAWPLGMQLGIFVRSGISVVFFDTLGSPGVKKRCFCRVLISDSLQALFVLC